MAGIDDQDSTELTKTVVKLVPLEANNWRSYAELDVAPHQAQYIDPNLLTIAEASFMEGNVLLGIEADGEPVGLVRIAESPETGWFYLWQLMVADGYQRLGNGSLALKKVIERVRGYPEATTLHTSYVPGEHQPRDFYIRFGFEETGQVVDGEHMMVLHLR